MKTREEKLKLVDETVEFFTTHFRCNGFHHHAYCAYWSHIAPHGCALGRLFKTEEERRNLEEVIVPSCESGQLYAVWKFIPDYIIDWGFKFLETLQKIHDTFAYWSIEGLGNRITKEGIDFVEFFKQGIIEGKYD